MNTPPAPAPKILFFFFIFLLSLLILCSTASGVFMKKHQEASMEEEEEEDLKFSGRQLMSTAPEVTVTVSPTPPLITVPSSTPATPPPIPVTNTPPVVAGQSWCVAKAGAAAASVQAALDYACGAGAECAAIQQGATCFSPDTLQNHASYAFSSFYQKHSGQPSSCDFKGAAEISHVNPSSGSCVYPTTSSSTSQLTAPPTPMTPNISTPTPMNPNQTTPTPMTPNPTTPTPMTPNPPILTPMTPNPAILTPMTPPSSGSLASPPTIFNRNNPPSGSGSTVFGDNPPTSTTSSTTMSTTLQLPFISFVISVATIVTVLDI